MIFCWSCLPSFGHLWSFGRSGLVLSFIDSDRNLQLIELLSPDGRGGTLCLHVVLASEDKEKILPGSSDNWIFLLPSGDDMFKPTGEEFHKTVVYTVSVNFGLST